MCGFGQTWMAGHPNLWPVGNVHNLWASQALLMSFFVAVFVLFFKSMFPRRGERSPPYAEPSS